MILDLSIEWGIDKDSIKLSAEMTQICNGFRRWSTGEESLQGVHGGSLPSTGGQTCEGATEH